ncbi:MAG: hypothetical protein ACXVW7_11455, partial [Trebonia sp.]
MKIRRAKIEAISRTAADEANLERPYGASGPALVKDARHDRRETAAEIVTRSGNPWAVRSDPLAGHTSYGRGDTAAGVISRAHDALGALESTLTRDGCEKLAQAFAESSGWPGMTVKRSKDEQAQAADLFLALSDP